MNRRIRGKVNAKAGEPDTAREGERHSKSPSSRGFMIDVARTRLSSYRLLTIFLAETELAPLRTGDWDSPPDLLHNEIAKHEIERLLVDIAVSVRMADDAAKEGRSINGRWNPTVGTLRSGPNKKENGLSLREACNKIIHATSISYRTTAGEFSWNDKLEPYVELIGHFRDEKWTAVVKIKEFCFAAVDAPE